ncbi:MAG: recombinase family protein [Pseudomonadota bacterium]
MVEGNSFKEIADQIFSSRQSVKKYLVRFGIPLRMEDRRITGSHVFGFKKRNRRAVPNSKEQEIINRIGSLKNKGFSYEKIAEILNVVGIGTKKKAIWYPKTVRQVLLR